MHLLDLIPAPTWRDIVDILFLTIVAYQLYVWFRESRALRVIIGLVALGGIYSIAKFWDLFLTTWAPSWPSTSLCKRTLSIAT